MTLLPVVERELRVAARERTTYRVRFLAAFLPIAFSLFSLWIVEAVFRERPIPPRQLFVFLTSIAFLFVSFAGFSLTCDLISQERRDATLGLLFLTDLKGYDIVLGKLSTAALRGLYALVATVPVLALPVMMGGTSLEELARTSLTLVVTLIFSMAVGLASSSFMLKSWSSFGLSAALILVFHLFLPLCSQMVRIVYRKPILAEWIQLPSPSYAFYVSFQSAIGLSTNPLPVSLSILSAASIIGVAIASLRTPHIWKDRPPTRTLARILDYLREWKFGAGQFRTQFRRRLLDQNPIFWLSRRERVSSLGLMLLLFAAGIAAASVGWRDWSRLDPRGNEVFPAIAWPICCIVSHVLILLRLSVIAAERFGEDRRSGALELILSTSISIKTVLHGHWLGLRRYFAGPVLLAFSFQTLWFAYMFTLETDPEFVRTLPQVFRDIFLHLAGVPMHPYRWELHFSVLVITGLFPLLALDWIALAWLSTWRSLRSKNPIVAPISSLVILHFPPVLAFFITAITLERFRLLPSHDFTEAAVLYLVIAGYFVLHQLLCIGWSRSRIYKHFRTAATDRYQPEPRRWWWRYSRSK